MFSKDGLFLLEVLWNMHPLSSLHVAGIAYGHLNLFNGVSVDILSISNNVRMKKDV